MNNTTWVVLLIVGVLVSMFTFISVFKGKKSRSWPSASATVTGTQVEIRHESDEEGDHTYYYPRVYYDYEVNGQHYTGDKIKLLDGSTSRRNAEGFITEYRQGDKITIFYNPEMPNEAVMFTGVQKYLYFFAAGGIALVIFSIYKLFI